MNPPSADSNFEKFRRERRQRRAQFGGLPATEQKTTGIKEIEAYEARQVHETRLSRDVHDFLAEATKHAATIVERVTQVAEAESAQRLVREMQEFLEETVRRAARFMHMVQATNNGAAVQDLEPHVSNIVGQELDEFRNEGTAQLADKHIGQDPFFDPSARTPAAGTAAAPSAPATAGTAPVQAAELLRHISRDPATLKRALKALVQAKVLTQDDARAAYKSALQESPP